ncbi:hypothetical protein [Halovivax cerinus]|uniref:Uncharacterized protein n=1 Tax=Halovivax cerinus TaxID=1487865 RepID=A0ABD5NIW5_9EURY|nr:hypothetical protein [Halovivax cerinus]
MSTATKRTRSLPLVTVLYFGAALLVGLPVMYVAYSLLTSLFFPVPFPVDFVLLAASFLIGMWVAERVSSALLERIDR